CWSRRERNARHASTRLGTKTAVANTSAIFLMPIHVVAPQRSFGERKLLLGWFADRFQKLPCGLAEFATGHFACQTPNGRFSESPQPDRSRTGHGLLLRVRTALAVMHHLLHQLPFHRWRDHFRAPDHDPGQSA